MSALAPTRRGFVTAALAAGSGAYFLSFTTPAQGRTGSDILTTHFLQVTPDDEIIVTSPVAEIGQGTATAYAMLVGDAMDAEWSRIRIELAPVDPKYNNPRFFSQLTGSSTGVSEFHAAFTKAGATARTMLIEAAARRWKVGAAQLTTENGVVVGPDGQRLRYGELAAYAARLPEPTVLIERTDTRPRYATKRMIRLDLPPKVDGSAQYAIDLRMPGMLSAAVVTSPVFGGKLLSDSRGAVLKVPGVKGVVDLPNGLAVVADRWWTARRALELLAPVWQATPHDRVDDAAISAQFARALATPGVVAEEVRGKGLNGLKDAETVLTRRYEVPYLAHTTMEPMSCVALVSGTTCDFWIGSQQPQKARDTVAALLGMAKEAVTFHPVIAGGGMGRRQETDVVEQAVLIANAFKISNVVDLGRRDETAKRQLEAAPIVLREYINEMLDAGRVRDATGTLQALFVYLRSDLTGRKAHTVMSNDPAAILDAFADDPRIEERYRTNNLATMRRQIAARRTAWGKLKALFRSDPTEE